MRRANSRKDKMLDKMFGFAVSFPQTSFVVEWYLKISCFKINVIVHFSHSIGVPYFVSLLLMISCHSLVRCWPPRPRTGSFSAVTDGNPSFLDDFRIDWTLPCNPPGCRRRTTLAAEILRPTLLPMDTTGISLIYSYTSRYWIHFEIFLFAGITMALRRGFRTTLPGSTTINNWMVFWTPVQDNIHRTSALFVWVRADSWYGCAYTSFSDIWCWTLLPRFKEETSSKGVALSSLYRNTIKSEALSHYR